MLTFPLKFRQVTILSFECHREGQNQILLSVLLSSNFPTFLRRTSGQSLGVFQLVMQLSLSETNSLSPFSHYLLFPSKR